MVGVVMMTAVVGSDNVVSTVVAWRRSPAATNNQRNPTCYECGNQGHYMSDCPKLKNQNHGNQVIGTRARGMVHALGGREINQDLNNMEDYINA
ncbi:DNA-directed DNA polymerase [Tanacetum coccineum]